MRALIGSAVEKFGRIDCLFNNAGGPAQTGGIEGLEVARFDAAMATLVRSVMLGMKHAAPHMRSQGSGSIINNGSIAGRLAGFSSSMVYGAAKAAVIHLTKCVAMELGKSGIRVNSISPGAIATGIIGKALGLSVEAAEKTPDVMREIYKTAQPIPRAGLPDDIAHAAVFLASDESSFINGHDLVIDGAMTGGRNWTQQQQGYVALRKAFDQGRRDSAFVEPTLLDHKGGQVNVRHICHGALRSFRDPSPGASSAGVCRAGIAGLACALLIGKALPVAIDTVAGIIEPLCADSNPAGSSPRHRRADRLTRLA